MASVSKLLAIGLPETGKTTFLAALWHVAESEEVPGSLRLQRISDDAKHLNNIKNEWLARQRVVRTYLGMEQPASFWFVDEKLGAIGELMFPDLSGESFEIAWAKRQWTKKYDDAAADADSLLLFIHPATVKEPYTIADTQKISEAAFPEEHVTQDQSKDTDSDTSLPKRIAEWTPEKAPTQVQLVEILQFVEQRLRAKRPIRLAAIISAWDLVKNNPPAGVKPRQWLSKRLSYLDQYLRANFEQFTVEVYGVSAQGGDLEADCDRLKKSSYASENIVIEGPDCAPHDISEPIRWALNLRNAATT